MTATDNNKQAASGTRKKTGSDSDKGSSPGFGTFGGVFTPCTLTILGVIMFLRFGYVVGNSGIFGALLIIAAAKSITVLTTMSLSAIATNTKVRGGGAYFLISRSLGVEFGGAIGVVFFLAQAISVAMYVIGFAEAFVAIVGDGMPPKLVAMIANVVVFVCVYVGASWTIKVQYLILASLVASLISFFLGGFALFSWSNVAANWGPAYVEGESLFNDVRFVFRQLRESWPVPTCLEISRVPGKYTERNVWAIGITASVYAVMASCCWNDWFRSVDQRQYGHFKCL